MWQGYAVLYFLWQFIIPLIIFVVAYWKILGVVRRRAKVAARRHRITVLSTQPVAGPSGGTTTAHIDAGQSTKGFKKGAGSLDHRQVEGQNESKSLSVAEMNVVKTMVYITVCFTLCWMPMYFNILYKRLTVNTLH